ncbi:MAG TPA: hypothetical protein VHX66_08370 [Solirubrobacteraceae bacterium]|jgi:hypothetical protein|nr:hypothetical protein [Solirubrobacteraceae bacterium]
MKVSVRSTGLVQIMLKSSTPGTLEALARVGHKNYATATTVIHAGTLSLTLSPTAAGRRAAQAQRRLTITLTLTPTAGGRAITRTISKMLPA